MVLAEHYSGGFVVVYFICHDWTTAFFVRKANSLLIDSGLRGLRFVGLLQDLSQVLGVDVDVIDVAHISANSPLTKEIEATGITIFP